MTPTNQTPQQPAVNLASLANLRIQMRQVLAEKGHLSTKELATEVKEDRNRVYRQCRRLESEGFVSRNRGSRGSLFCVDCHRVVTSETYMACKGHDIRSFNARVTEWEAIPQGPHMPQPKSV